jgi:osmotically inducible protein OsmC
MAEILRSATATWTGDLKGGSGSTSTDSGYVKDVKITWSSRFEQNPGSNPEELIAAAHASCFSMSIASNLTRQNTPPKEIHAKATLTMQRDDSGTKLTKMHLEVEASVPGIDAAAFQAVAEKAKETCPISMLLKPGLEEITLDAKLIA